MSSLINNGNNQQGMSNLNSNEIPMLLPTNMNGGNQNFGGNMIFGDQMNMNQGGSYQQPSLLNELNHGGSNDDYQHDDYQQSGVDGMNVDEDDQNKGGDDISNTGGDGGGEGSNNNSNNHSGNNNNNHGNRRQNNQRRGRRNHQGNTHATHTGNRGQPAVFISAEGSPRTYAAKIAEHVRDGQPPVLMAAGANSINQATKSLAYAREYLASDGLDLSAQPEYRQREDGGLTRSTTALSFQCIILQLPKVTSVMDVELKVSKRSDPNTIAGAIAGKCREHLRVGIQSIGPVCTVRAVSAIAIARRYLVNDGHDLRFRPEFISCEFEEGSSCMGLRLTILQMQV